MESEGLLPHSQVPATCPYPEPVRFSPSQFLKIHLNIILPSTPGSSLMFPHQNPLYNSPVPHSRYVPPISLFSILSQEQF